MSRGSIRRSASQSASGNCREIHTMAKMN